MQDRAATLMRTVRIVRIAFLVSGVLLIYVMVRIPAQVQAPPSPALVVAITFIALAIIYLGFLAPRFLGPKRPTEGQPQAKLIEQWMRANLVSLACFDACMLFGFVLHFVGARVLNIAGPFAAGMISLLVWKPQAVPTTEDE